MSLEPMQPTGQESIKVPVYEEEASVDKRVVETGRGVRIHKIMAEHPYQIDERLTHDDIQVTHVPVDRIVALDQASATHCEGSTLVVPILEELSVVERRLRIKEELHITKARREERHAETVMLRQEQVRVERFDEAGDFPSTSSED